LSQSGWLKTASQAGAEALIDLHHAQTPAVLDHSRACRNVGLLCAYVTATVFYATFIAVQKNDLAAIVTQAHSCRESDRGCFIAIYEYTP